ncbi:tyrosine-type recombinase/integrase [Sulfurospirillum tamanense]|uniref:tyrosine-type recombinase/integrase n=1 Tax=Sulfurospirillum tamanense TaxID=2813362 RepID=UPI0034E23D86
MSDVKIWYLTLKDVTPKSKKGYLTVLKGIFDVAYYDDIIQKNPVLHVKPEKYTTPKINPFTADEVKALLEYVKGTNFNYVYLMAIGFYTGMRTGEILALKKSEVDLEKRIIKIRSTRSRFGEGMTKTHGSQRDIPIIDLLYPYVERMHGLYNGCPYMLTNQYGQPYRDTYVFICQSWKPALKALGLDYRRPYTMRHTYATNMLYRNLVTPVQLAQLLGHTSTEMVFNVYVNYLQRQNEKFNRSMSVYN